MATPDEIEAQFYEALQTADLERLMALWINDELVRCIHPGGPLLVGATAIRASFGWASRPEEFDALADAWIKMAARARPQLVKMDAHV